MVVLAPFAFSSCACYPCGMFDSFFMNVHAELSSLVGGQVPVTLGACPRCRKRLPTFLCFLYMGDRKGVSRRTPCPWCGIRLTMDKIYSPEFREKYGDDFGSLLPSPGKHFSRTWNHFTVRSDWESNLVNGLLPLVHVGSKFSAFERVFSEFAYTGEHEEYYRISVRLRPSAVFSGVCDDQCVFWEDTVVPAGEYCSYVNEYEGAGSVSLICDPSVLEVVDMEKRDLVGEYGELLDLLNRVDDFLPSLPVEACTA